MPRRARPAMTPSAIWSLNAMTAVVPLSRTRGTASAAASKVGAGVSIISDLHADRATGLADRRSALACGPRAGRPSQEDQVPVPESGEMDERLVNGRRAPQQHRGVTADGTLHEHRRHGAEGLEFAVEAPRGQDDEPVDVVGEGSGDLDLFLRVLAGIREQHLQLGSRAVRSTARTMEAKYGLVMSGTITAMLPVRPGLHHPRGTVRHESELLHRAFDPLARRRGDLLRTAQRTRHGCRVHLGAGRHVEDRDASRGPHGHSTLHAGPRASIMTATTETQARLSARTLGRARDSVSAHLRQNGAGEHRAPRARRLRPGPPRRLRGRSVSAWAGRR